MTNWTTDELDQTGSSPKPQIDRHTDGRQTSRFVPSGSCASMIKLG
jgi:hypothetical protein